MELSLTCKPNISAVMFNFDFLAII